MLIELILTRECNFNCSYCYIKKNSNKMSYEQVSNIIKTFYNGSKLEIVFFGGEPLLEYKLIQKIVEKSINGGLNISFILPTNASLLNQEKTSFLQKNKVKLSISYDGPFTQLRRGNIPPKLSNISKHCHKVITPQSLHLLEADINGIINEGYTYITCSLDKQSNWDLTVCETLKTNLYKIAKIYQKNYEKIDLGIFTNPIRNYFKHRKFVGCGAGVTRIAIDTDNKIYPCSALVGSPEYLLGIVGNFSPNNFLKPCEKCEYSEFCEGMCLVSDTYCNGQKAIFEVSKSIYESLKENALWRESLGEINE